jgi:hypothetical protein
VQVQPDAEELIHVSLALSTPKTLITDLAHEDGPRFSGIMR